MDDFDADPLDQETSLPIHKTAASEARLTPSNAVEAINRRTAALLEVSESMYQLWLRLPEITTRDVDVELRKIHAKYADALTHCGISRMASKEMRDCCSGRASWPDSAAPLGWGLGDIVRRVTRFLGFKHCQACERRRMWLNSLFRKR